MHARITTRNLILNTALHKIFFKAWRALLLESGMEMEMEMGMERSGPRHHDIQANIAFATS